MIKLQPELVLMVVIVCKQTEIRQLLQGINREGFHFPGLQFLKKCITIRMIQIITIVIIMALAQAKVLIKPVFCRWSSGQRDSGAGQREVCGIDWCDGAVTQTATHSQSIGEGFLFGFVLS